MQDACPSYSFHYYYYYCYYQHHYQMLTLALICLFIARISSFVFFFLPFCSFYFILVFHTRRVFLLLFYLRRHLMQAHNVRTVKRKSALSLSLSLSVLLVCFASHKDHTMWHTQLSFCFLSPSRSEWMSERENALSNVSVNAIASSGGKL